MQGEEVVLHHFRTTGKVKRKVLATNEGCSMGPCTLAFVQAPPFSWGFPGGLVAKNPLAVQEMKVQSLGWEDIMEKEMATCSNILAWEIPWTEEPEGLQSVGSQEWPRT